MGRWEERVLSRRVGRAIAFKSQDRYPWVERALGVCVRAGMSHSLAL